MMVAYDADFITFIISSYFSQLFHSRQHARINVLHFSQLKHEIWKLFIDLRKVIAK